ncbi:class I SAM-dependent methyltransferase [Foetidibacter luteolus]|uniref:class I SAM-dependent methyltransferase n=1 Tax=Foetidibacter luteolus TaxID=2608880 RepID=UPI00129A631B|nr:class I SAM-dependent methyltransferase [Foetidibacter luteolus]
MTDIFGTALYDYYQQKRPGKLWIHNRYGPKEEMPLGAYFRTEADMNDIELTALRQCRGTVIDVGAGAGTHTLLLQRKGLDVTALEISPGAVAVMKQRGVKKIIQRDFFACKGKRFDTLLLLMNGIGLVQTLSGLHQFLQHAATMLQPGGRLLFDSSDVAYIYDKKNAVPNNYYGEIDYRYEYKKQKSGWFKWLYVDRQTLKQIARQHGWNCRIIREDENGQYLARLTRKDANSL